VSKITRLPDWRTRLEVAMNDLAAQPFRPGTVDCAQAAAIAVLAMTGTDLRATFKGSYSSLKGGFKILRKAGYSDLADLVGQYFPEVPVAFGQVGDIAVLTSGKQPALGIVQGARIYIRAQTGLATASLLSAERMFRV